MTEPDHGSPDGNLSRIDELSTAVRELTAQVATFSKANAEIAAKLRTTRLMLFITIIGLLLDVCLSGLFIYQHVEQVETNNQIACQNKLRSESNTIADRDRVNVDNFFQAVVKSKTEKQFEAAYQHYLTIRNADDAARAKLGAGSSSTCG